MLYKRDDGVIFCTDNAAIARAFVAAGLKEYHPRAKRGAKTEEQQEQTDTAKAE